MTTSISERKKELYLLGVKTRLAQINEERDTLLDILGYKNGLAEEVADTVEAIRRVRKNKKHKFAGLSVHWTQTEEGRRHMSKIAKKQKYYRKFANGNGNGLPRKKKHWTQTPEGKIKLSIQGRKMWRSRER